MYPILYEQITAGTVPQHNGLGVLSDCISCYIEQTRNGAYELVIEYPLSGIHAEDIVARRVIKAKPNPTDNLQLFRIDRVSKVMNGKFTVYAKHISYDLSGYDITSGTASSISNACSLLQSSASGWTITTDKTTAGSFKITEPSSVRSWFGGKEGSILDVYGGADIKYDNFSVQFLNNAGQDRGVTIRYGKNLLELSQEIEDTLCTDVRCYYKNEDVVVTGDKVSTGLTLDVPKCLVVDCSQDYESAPTVVQLTTKATEYKNKHNLTISSNNITLDFVQSGELSERVDLCDTVSIYYEALGITRTGAKCVRTKYDCIKEKYIETEFGDVQTDLSSTLAVVSKKLTKTPTTTFMQEAISHATELITGNLGGYVILHDSNNDGQPDEILIMNTDDITTATQIWRWNKNGLGYATSYAGPYGTAITSDGKIVADYITTGVLNANLIKAGVIQDVAGNSTIDMTNGEARMKNFSAVGFKAYNPDTNKVLGQFRSLTDSAGLYLYDGSGTTQADLTIYQKGGALELYNNSNKLIVQLGVANYGQYDYGQLELRTAAGDKRAFVSGDYNGGGGIQLNDSLGSAPILLSAYNGQITCVLCVQTSSRKVKENIKPIEDADKILNLNAVSFDYKNKAYGTNKRGFIAEDVQKVIPNLVIDGEIPSLDYIGMIPYLHTVIKEQDKRIKSLEEKIEKLYNERKGE